MNDNISDKDKKDWNKFINSTEKLPDKDLKNIKKKNKKTRSIDLHGFTLDEANKTIENFINMIYNGIGSAVEWIKGKFNAAMDIVSGILKAPFNMLIGAINLIIKGLNMISITIPNWVPFIGGKTLGFNIGEVPYLQEGGSVEDTGLAVVHKGEVVLPEAQKLPQFDLQPIGESLAEINAKLIDETDTAIIGNDTKLTLVKEFIPTIGSSLTYNINFSNAIVHPHSGHIGALSSTKFTIVDGENILRTNCALDDLDGVIRVFRLVNNKKTIVNSSLGTIDYTTGKIILNSFNPTAFVGSTLQITVSPESYDIIPLREQIIQISSSLLTVNVNDISAIKSARPTTAPPTISEWPPRYLVVE